MISRMKTSAICLVSIVLLGGAAGGTGFYYVKTPMPATGDTTVVFVQPGMSVTHVADRLEQEGLIRDARWFKLYARYREVDSKIKVGRYSLASGETIDEILETLVSGEGGTEQVTIPEGLTINRIAVILHERIDIDSTVFISLAKDSDFATELGIEAPGLEGYLFPNTYKFYKGIAPDLVIGEMTRLFHKIMSPENREKAKEMEMSIHDIMTLASIIEGEAQLASERNTISGVFHNRLRSGRRLESCATVQYVLGEPKAVLLDKDLKIPSPYNTYLHAGLPPGPISSPGAAAIEAALNPADVPYLYFVARGDGGHIFSRSNREHVNAKNRLKQNGGRI